MTAHVSVLDLGMLYDGGGGPGGRQDGAVEALRGITFSVKRGEFLALVGPSGCGKSTLLRIIAGLRSASSGEVRVDGELVSGPTRVGMVFQTPALLPWKTALENVLLAPQLAGLRRSSYRQRARELLDLVGLADAESRLPGQLSGGMQQRVAICRALILDPDLLLMDEPFAALDAMTRDDMSLELLRIWSSSARGKTALFVTHSIPEAVFLADRVLVMSAGPGRVKAIRDVPFDRPREARLRASELFAKESFTISELLHGRDAHDPAAGVPA